MLNKESRPDRYQRRAAPLSVTSGHNGEPMLLLTCKNGRKELGRRDGRTEAPATRRLRFSLLVMAFPFGFGVVQVLPGLARGVNKLNAFVGHERNAALEQARAGPCELRDVGLAVEQRDAAAEHDRVNLDQEFVDVRQ